MDNQSPLQRKPISIRLAVLGGLVIILLQLNSAYTNWLRPEADAFNTKGWNLVGNFLVPFVALIYLRYLSGSWGAALTNPAGLPMRDERERAIAHKTTATTLGIAIVLILLVSSLLFILPISQSRTGIADLLLALYFIVLETNFLLAWRMGLR